MSLLLTPEEVAGYSPLAASEPDIYAFGVDPRDWAGLGRDEWFHANQGRFLFDLNQLPRLPHGLNVGPNGEGVYFLFLDDDLVYVGQSKHIRSRLHRHGYPTPCRIHEGWFNNYAAIWVPQWFLDSVESFYIHYLDPPRNEKLPPQYGPACDYLEPT